MFIAIEGMDGVGKTSLSKKIAESYGFQYIDNPMQKVLDITPEKYNSICNLIWSKENEDIKLCFFMTGNLMTKYYGENIVTDRYALSSFYWDGNDNNLEIFKYFYQKEVIPDLTFILYADIDARINRIAKRDSNDPDLYDAHALNYGYDKMTQFANEVNMPYILINTDNKNENEVFKYVSEIIMTFLTSKPEDVIDFCSKYNETFYNEKEEHLILKLKKKESK